MDTLESRLKIQTEEVVRLTEILEGAKADKHREKREAVDHDLALKEAQTARDAYLAELLAIKSPPAIPSSDHNVVSVAQLKVLGLLLGLL